MAEKIAVYPGSFDPITCGHLDIIKRAVKIFDRVIVSVARNYDKQSLFTVEEKIDMIKEVVKSYPTVSVDTFHGLLMAYMKQVKATVALRGLRATSDFEYEYHMAAMNRSLDDEIDTLFMMTGKDYFFISSRTIKEVAGLGGAVEGLVPQYVAVKLRQKTSQDKK